jgi:ABC-type transport system involved in cytochrome bd biosynthesis fused ATPase/permease subunit
MSTIAPRRTSAARERSLEAEVEAPSLAERRVSSSRPPPTSARACMTAERVSAWYGDERALSEVSLPLYDRRVTAIIGPSGCGKSTLCAASTACTR